MTNEFERLENALVRAGRGMEYPATPPIAARVRNELTREVSPRAFVPTRNRARILVPLAAALILALALLLTIPATRDAVAQFLGLRGLRIFYATPTSPPTPLLQGEGSATRVHPSPAGSEGTQTLLVTATPRPTATQTIQPFTLCCETILHDAQQRARFKLLVPPDELPSRVYYQNVFDNGEQVVMMFGDAQNPRFTLYQAQRWIYGKMLGKELNEHTLLGEAQVNGERALWFSGAPHVVVMLDARGEPIYQTRRTVDANTLVWETGAEDDGVIYRLETKLSLNEAARFAESLQEYRP